MIVKHQRIMAKLRERDREREGRGGDIFQSKLFNGKKKKNHAHIKEELQTYNQAKHFTHEGKNIMTSESLKCTAHILAYEHIIEHLI